MNPMVPLFVTLSTLVEDKTKRIRKRYIGDDRGASIVEYIALLFIVALIVLLPQRAGRHPTEGAQASR